MTTIRGTSWWQTMPLFLTATVGERDAVMHVADIRSIPGVEHRLARSDVALRAALRAKELHARLSISFMDAFISLAIEAEADPGATLETLALHQHIAPLWESVKLQDISSEWLEKRSASTSEQTLTVISSRAILSDGSTRHVPMLDFSLPSTPENEAWAREALDQLGMPGVLINSGRSYHFYGARLVDDEHLRIFLGKALLFAGIMDRRWVAHQLIEGSCALRVGGGDSADMRVVATVL